jgi:hypothetical protein
VQVESYDAEAQTVTVKPQIQEQYLDDNGEIQNEVLQVLSGVPVQFPRGGSFRLTFPIAKGDTGLVVFADRSIDAWLQGPAPSDTAPTDARRHSLSDAVYIPGVNVQGQAWTAASPSVISMGSDTGEADFVATAQRTLTQLNRTVADLAAFADAVNGWMPVPNDGGGALKTALLALFATGGAGGGSWPSSVSSPASATVQILG